MQSEKSLMFGCFFLLITAVAALAQAVPGDHPKVTIASGVPLRMVLEHRVAIKRVGEPVQGRLIESIYVFDRLVLPAGSAVEGHIAEIGGVPVRRRITAILSGNFTPSREVRAQFDALTLSDGSRLSFRTSLSRGTAHTVRIAKRRKKLGQPPQGDRDGFEKLDPAAILAFKVPGKASQLKSALLARLPYQRQAWPAGTLFTGVLQEPLVAPAPNPVEAGANNPAAAQAEAQIARARLLTPISSATATRGAPVEAIVARPVFSTNHALLIPEGSLLLGDVVEAQAARPFHRNGKVLFLFRQIKPPAGAVQGIQGYLEGVEADFDNHVALDSEGATRVSSPKTRFIFPAIAVAVAGLSFHQDYNAQGVPDQDIAGRAESGAVGLGLIGTLVAQASRTLASSIAIAGAGWSVYSTFIARGEDLVLPANTPVNVSVRSRGEAGGGQSVKRGLH